MSSSAIDALSWGDALQRQQEIFIKGLSVKRSLHSHEKKMKRKEHWVKSNLRNRGAILKRYYRQWWAREGGCDIGRARVLWDDTFSDKAIRTTVLFRIPMLRYGSAHGDNIRVVYADFKCDRQKKNLAVYVIFLFLALCFRSDLS